MRIVLLSIVASSACTPEEQPIAWQSALGFRTNGVGLHTDGDIGHAGMAGTNCPFETARGTVTGDYDLPGTDEEIQDLGDSPLGTETVLAVMTDTVWLLEKSTGEYRTEQVDLPGVGEARLSDAGVVAIRARGGACEVVWTEDGATADVPCATGFTVDPVDGTAFVGASDGVVVARRGAPPVALATGGDLVAWDRTTEALYVGQRGGDVLTALEADGTVRWQVIVDGALQSIASAGAAEAAAMVLARDDGFGAVAFTDGYTGDPRGDLLTPTPATDLTVARSGRVVALESPNDVHFYRL